MQINCVLILHNIRSIHNVGSLFRTADAAGVDEILLSGYTPTPLDRFGRTRNDLAKVALGAEKSVPWKTTNAIHRTIGELKALGYTIVALEQDTGSVDYKAHTTPGNIALIVGNEPDGIPKDILEFCDAIVEIPMKGEKESLNVSVAGGIALYRLLDV